MELEAKEKKRNTDNDAAELFLKLKSLKITYQKWK